MTIIDKLFASLVPNLKQEFGSKWMSVEKIYLDSPCY